MVGVVGRRGIIVFATNEIDPHHARIGRRQLEAEKRLGERGARRDVDSISTHDRAADGPRYPTISAFLKQKAISIFAVSGLSEPCTEFF